MTGRRSPKAMVRFPDGMRDQIKERARTAGRSMNAEIVQILSAALNSNHQAEEALMPSAKEENGQIVIRPPVGMREQIKAAAETNGRSMNSEIVLALQAHLAGIGQSTPDHRMMLAGQVLSGILSGPNAPNVLDRLSDANAAHIAFTSAFLADKLIDAAQALAKPSPSEEEEFVT